MNDPFSMRALKLLLTSGSLPQAPPGRAHRMASVMMPIFESGGEAHLLAVLKTDTVGYPWRNQVALPGGHIDPTDRNALAAALREIREELNISPGGLDIIGSLGHFPTIRQTEIETFVAFWDGDRSPIRFDALEISRVLEVPIRVLARTHTEKHYENRVPHVFELLYPFEDGEGIVIWGVTARIIHHFLEHLRRCAPGWFRKIQ